MTVQVLIEFVKSAFIDFAAESMMVPWIYVCYNREFGQTANLQSTGGPQSGGSAGDASATADKSKK